MTRFAISVVLPPPDVLSARKTSTREVLVESLAALAADLEGGGALDSGTPSAPVADSIVYHGDRTDLEGVVLEIRREE